MSNFKVEICPVCGVKIEGQDKVIFSHGSIGTRARLWVRVCNYVQNPNCINQDQEVISQIRSTDYYL